MYSKYTEPNRCRSFSSRNQLPQPRAEATEATSVARGRRGRRVERVVVVRAVAGAAATARLQRHLAVLQKSNGIPYVAMIFPYFGGILMDFPELEWNHVGPGKPNKKANGVLVMSHG